MVGLQDCDNTLSRYAISGAFGGRLTPAPRQSLPSLRKAVESKPGIRRTLSLYGVVKVLGLRGSAGQKATGGSALPLGL